MRNAASRLMSADSRPRAMLNGQTSGHEGGFASQEANGPGETHLSFWADYLLNLPRLALPTDSSVRQKRSSDDLGHLIFDSSFGDIRRSRDRLIILGGQFVPMNQV